MSSRIPGPCDVPRGEHEGPVRLFPAGYRCTAHAPKPRPVPEPGTQTT